jgi:hypothetical protein
MGFNFGSFAGGMAKTWNSSAIGGAINDYMSDSGVQDAKDQYEKDMQDISDKTGQRIVRAQAADTPEGQGGAGADGTHVAQMSNAQIQGLADPKAREYFTKFYQQNADAGNAGVQRYSESDLNQMRSDAAAKRDKAIEDNVRYWKGSKGVADYYKNEASVSEAKLSRMLNDGKTAMLKEQEELSKDDQKLFSTAAGMGFGGLTSKDRYDAKTNSVLKVGADGKITQVPLTDDLRSQAKQFIQFNRTQSLVTSMSDMVAAQNYRFNQDTYNGRVAYENAKLPLAQRKVTAEERKAAAAEDAAAAQFYAKGVALRASEVGKDTAAAIPTPKGESATKETQKGGLRHGEVEQGGMVYDKNGRAVAVRDKELGLLPIWAYKDGEMSSEYRQAFEYMKTMKKGGKSMDLRAVPKGQLNMVLSNMDKFGLLKKN